MGKQARLRRARQQNLFDLDYDTVSQCLQSFDLINWGWEQCQFVPNFKYDTVKIGGIVRCLLMALDKQLKKETGGILANIKWDLTQVYRDVNYEFSIGINAENWTVWMSIKDRQSNVLCVTSKYDDFVLKKGFKALELS